MPVYCYTIPDGETVEASFPMGGAPSEIVVNGEKAYRDRRAENVRGSVRELTATRHVSARWPMEPCCASGVNACQAQDLRDFFKKHGMNVHVTDSGDPVYESPQQRKKALKLRGMHDRNSFD